MTLGLVIFIFAVLLPISLFFILHFREIKRVNGDCHFQNDGLPSSWIFKFRFFSGPYGSEVQYASALQIPSKSVKRVLKYRVFSIFKIAACVCYLGLLKSQNFIG